MHTLRPQQPPGRGTLEELRFQLEEERAARAQTKEELDLRSCALDAATTHFMIIDVSVPTWRIVYVNRAICEHHGYGSAELLDQSPSMLTDAEQSSTALERVAEAVRRGTNIGVELVAIRKD